MIILYISGPMAGYPELNHPAFNAAEATLTAAGYYILNPASSDLPPDLGWADYLRYDLRLVLDSDGIAVLPNWEASRGAKLEVEVAQRLGIPVLPLAVWLTNAKVVTS
jgi:hypothetical protein